MKNPQYYFRLRICFFTVQEQESPQVALEVLDCYRMKTINYS